MPFFGMEEFHSYKEKTNKFCYDIHKTSHRQQYIHVYSIICHKERNFNYAY